MGREDRHDRVVDTNSRRNTSAGIDPRSSLYPSTDVQRIAPSGTCRARSTAFTSRMAMSEPWWAWLTNKLTRPFAAVMLANLIYPSEVPYRRIECAIAYVVVRLRNRQRTRVEDIGHEVEVAFEIL